MVFHEPGRSEYGNAGTYKVQCPVSCQDLAKYFPGKLQFETAALGTVQVKRPFSFYRRDITSGIFGIGHGGMVRHVMEIL